MILASEDTSIVPEATKFENEVGPVWELELSGYPIVIASGAWHWRVWVLDPLFLDTTLLITPHVFNTARDAYDWVVSWMAGHGTWGYSWGPKPSWQPCPFGMS